MNTCILGATGSIGFELTVHLLQTGSGVLAVVRDAEKLQRMLRERGFAPDPDALSVVEQDLFAGPGVTATPLSQELLDCEYIFNMASKPVSLAPWSRVNREWGSAVSSLTRKIVETASVAGVRPHVVAFCGTEQFAGYDSNISLLQKILPKVLNRMSAALRDNHDEAMFLLTSGYGRWSVLRCGSIRSHTGQPGDASRIGMDLHEDGSDYRSGRGKSLVVEDLAAYLARAIQNGTLSGFETEMPFLFNTRF